MSVRQFRLCDMNRDMFAALCEANNLENLTNDVGHCYAELGASFFFYCNGQSLFLLESGIISTAPGEVPSIPDQPMY